MSQSNTSQSSVLNNEKTLKAAIKDCMMRDQFRLHKRVQGAARIKNEQAKHAVFDEIALDIAKSMQTVELRATQRPTITYQNNCLSARRKTISPKRLSIIRS